MPKEEHLIQLTQLILTKVDKLDSRQDDMDKVLIRNTMSLEEHVRRTNLLEQQVIPIKAHVDFMQHGALWVARVVGVLTGAAGLAGAVYKLISYLS